jgi:very-short-patch-repair endonuclease
MRRVLDELDASAHCESVLETKVARLLRASGLPAPVRQYEVTMFGRRYRLDFAWPEFRIALECDGRAFHEFQRDRTRWRQLGAAGWTVLPVTWSDVTRNWPAVLDELRSVFS